MYEIWFGDVMFPVAPENIKTSVAGNNTTFNLINESEVNQIKGMKLTGYSFELMIPAVSYPWAVYTNGFQVPDYYLSVLESFKKKKKPFKFKVIRKDYAGNPTWDTNVDVTLESYEYEDDAEEMLDIKVSIELKQYKKFGTKKVKVRNGKMRRYNVDTTKRKIVKSYMTKKGDTLRMIGKKVYGVNSQNNAEVRYKKNKKKFARVLKIKFAGKFTKRLYTTSLPAGIRISVPGLYENMLSEMVTRR